MDRVKNLPSNISELRRKAKLTQEQLAKKVEMSRPTITSIEKGKRRVSVEELLRFSEVLNCSLEDLLGTEKKTSTDQKVNKNIRELYVEYKEKYQPKEQPQELVDNPLDDYLRQVNPYYYPTTNNEIKYGQ